MNALKWDTDHQDGSGDVYSVFFWALRRVRPLADGSTVDPLR